MNQSIEAQLATAWDMATREIQQQAEQIKKLQSSLEESAGTRARMAAAKQAAEIQIAENALTQVDEMLRAEDVDRAGIGERLARVTSFLAGLRETAQAQATPPAGESSPAVALESRR